jgi:lysylphosphatidylglycerol synthetase-like protein (DUF2156 family)
MRTRHAMIPVFGLAVIAAWCLLGAIRGSGVPGNYYRFRHSATGFVYPTDDVLTWCGVIVAELVVAIGILWWTTGSLPRTCVLLAACLGVPFAVLLPLGMHAPPYFAMHLVFLMFATIWLIVAAIITRHAAKSANDSARRDARLPTSTAA